MYAHSRSYQMRIIAFSMNDAMDSYEFSDNGIKNKVFVYDQLSQTSVLQSGIAAPGSAEGEMAEAGQPGF